jgi:branched-chain amino acid transport system ATP-binding protein
MIVVEQKPKKILPFTDQAIVLDRGAIAHAASSAELLANTAALDAHLTATKKAPQSGSGSPIAPPDPTATARRPE